MFCESWRERLSAAAVSGEALRHAEQAHLAACGSCRAALVDEQQLVALMDSGLRSVVGADTPASLLPRVRARIAETSPARTWRIPALAFAAAAMALIAAIAFPPSHVLRTKEQSATASMVSPRESWPQTSQPSVPPVPASASPVKRGTTALIPTDVPQARPDITISADEQTSLQRYLSAFRAGTVKGAAPVTLKTESALEIKPLEIFEIEMPQLSIEQLQGGESR